MRNKVDSLLWNRTNLSYFIHFHFCNFNSWDCFYKAQPNRNKLNVIQNMIKLLFAFISVSFAQFACRQTISLSLYLNTQSEIVHWTTTTSVALHPSVKKAAPKQIIRNEVCFLSINSFKTSIFHDYLQSKLILNCLFPVRIHLSRCGMDAMGIDEKRRPKINW